MSPTLTLIDTHSNNTLSPYIHFSGFPLLETTPTTQEIIAAPNDSAAVSCATLYHFQLTTDPNIAALTR